jgi:putative ABC transport system substrate-binding protein
VGVLLPLLTASPAPAQDSRPAPRRLAAFLWHEAPNDLDALAGIRKALATAGVPHELLVRQADSDRARADAQLAELRAAGPELVFALGTQAVLLARGQLGAIPIVFTAVTNPVVSRVVPSWDGSGGALAGNSNWIAPETVLHVFQLAVPGLARLGMLRSRNAGVVSAAELQAMRARLAQPGAPALEVVEAVVDDERGIAGAVRALRDARVQALWVPIDFTIYQNMAAVRDALGRSGVPIVTSALQAARSGAAAGVVVDYELLGQRAAVLALDVLERRRAPASIPVETMRSYQVIVDLDAARRCGYELPLSLLVIADVLLDASAPGRAQ